MRVPLPAPPLDATRPAADRVGVRSGGLAPPGRPQLGSGISGISRLSSGLPQVSVRYFSKASACFLASAEASLPPASSSSSFSIEKSEASISLACSTIASKPLRASSEMSSGVPTSSIFVRPVLHGLGHLLVAGQLGVRHVRRHQVLEQAGLRLAELLLARVGRRAAAGSSTAAGGRRGADQQDGGAHGRDGCGTWCGWPWCPQLRSIGRGARDDRRPPLRVSPLVVHPEGCRQREAQARLERLEVLRARTAYDAEGGQVRRLPLHVEHPASRRAGRRAGRRAPAARPWRRRARRWNIDSPAKSPPMLTP